MKPIYFQCKVCKGTKKVPERDYIARCGLSDCNGVIHKKEDAIQKKRFWRKHWTFKCPICDKVFGRGSLIEWPMIPCPNCQGDQNEMLV